MRKIDFEEQYKDNKIIKNVLKGFQIKFTYEEVINFFSNETKELELFFSTNIHELYKGIDKAIYLYFILKYITKEKLIENNILPPNVLDNINRARNFEFIDYRYVNELHNGILNSLSNNVIYSNFDYKLSKKFEDYILNDIPKNYLKIERAIYIYLKLCYSLKYSEEYFIKFHSNREYIVGTKNLEKVINDKSNEVVCYEFCNLLNYFLLKEGNFVYNNVDEFGQNDEHEKSLAVIDKYVVLFDSTASILIGDITNVKFNKPLNGISLFLSSDRQTYLFNQIVFKVYNNFKKDFKLPLNSINTYKNLKQLIKRIEDISDEKLTDYKKSKIIFYLNSIYEYYTEGMDFVSNNIYKKHDILAKEEQEEIVITLISDETAEIKKIISIMSIKTNNNGYLYLKLHNNSLAFISKEELNQKLDKNEYKLLNGGQCTSYNIIPGIDYYDGKRKILKSK